MLGYGSFESLPEFLVRTDQNRSHVTVIAFAARELKSSVGTYFGLPGYRATSPRYVANEPRAVHYTVVVSCGALLAISLWLGAQNIQVASVATGISAPTDIQSAGDGSGRLFLVQQNGLIRILRNGVVSASPFLDISSKTRTGGELGLLGLAFPPGFAQKQRFYVDYTDLQGNTVIAQYRMTANPDVADANSEIALLNITQPFANHKGGQLRFGPDGYLYIGMGDGGSGGDPFGNGQNLGTLLGKLLRIDVESDSGHVRIPGDNPFLNRAGARPEIWAFGMRNPWRFSFDSANNALWIADVGQDRYEEIDLQPASSHGGENYGWNLMEGLHCYTAGCNPQGLVLPIAEYPHGPECSVTGGFVYRGRVSPGLRGLYLYGDYCSGKIWGLERQGTAWTNHLLLASGFSITTFGQDDAGELYVANTGSGAIYHINGGHAPRLNSANAVNAASFAPGLVAGSLATVFVAGVRDDAGITGAESIPLPLSLGDDVSVVLNGVPAPLHAVANVNGQEQVNFQVPFGLTGATVSLVVRRAGLSSDPADVPLLDLQPAIYTTDGTQAVVVRDFDYSLVTSARPVEPNEYVFLYASGLGSVTNPPAAGSASPSELPLSSALAHVGVKVAGQTADVQFAGLAPGLVGVYQVNFRVPANVPSGSQTLVLMADAISSPETRVSVR